MEQIHMGHAQRHVGVGRNTCTRSSLAKKFKNVGPKMVYLQILSGTCKFVSDHRSAGQYYRHVCKNYEGLHVTRLCTQKYG